MNRRSAGGAQHLSGDRWRLYVEAPPDPVTGRRRRRSQIVHAATRRAANELLADFLSSRPAAVAPEMKRTVDELCDAWLDHLDVAGSTKNEWADSLRRYVRPNIGHRQVVDVDVQMLETLWRRLQQTGGREGGALAASTVRKARAALRLAYAQALRWRWVTFNVVAESKVAGSGGQTKVNAPDPADIATITAKLDRIDSELATWLRLTAHLGTRKEESLGLRWSSIDLDAGTVTIRTVVTKAGSKLVIIDRPKTATSVRTVAIAPAHVVALKAMRARHIERAIAVGAPWSEDRFVLAPDDLGARPYYPTSVSRRLRVLEVRHKLPRVTIRQLRHHMATQAISRGHDVRTVAGRGGWANPDTLLRVYADWVPARDQALAADLDAGAL